MSNLRSLSSMKQLALDRTGSASGSSDVTVRMKLSVGSTSLSSMMGIMMLTGVPGSDSATGKSVRPVKSGPSE